MLKSKIKFITLAVIMTLILSLTSPIVRAENDTDNAVDNTMSEENLSAQDSNIQTESNSDKSSSEENYKKEDVYLVGDDITIDYIIDGNLFVFAKNVNINSQIGGDAFIFANTINIGTEGYVFSNLFACSQELNISGVVYDLYNCSQKTSIDGYVYRDIHVATNDFNLTGTIGRNAFLTTENLNLPSNNNEDSEDVEIFSEDSGIIYGNLNYNSKNEISIPEGVVGGSITYNQLNDSEGNNTKTIQDYIFDLGTFVVTIAIIWLLVLWIAPKFLEESNDLVSKKALPSLGFGALTSIIIVMASIILLLLGITAKIALLGILLLTLLLFIGTPIFTISMSKFISNKLKIEKNIISFGILIITSIVIWLITLIPFVGWIINLIIKIIGLGIIVNYIFINRKKNNNTISKEVKTNEENNENKETKGNKKNKEN